MKLPALIFFAALSSPAVAAAPLATATIGSTAETRVVADGVLWKCADGTCRGAAEARPVALQRACKDIARRVGAVNALAAGNVALSPEALADCNTRARKTDDGAIQLVQKPAQN